MTQRSFPSEIEDQIIAAACQVAGPSKRELLTCALVCRSWVPASRYNLFHQGTITISPTPADVRLLLNVLGSPLCTIRSHITTLRVEGKGTRNSWGETWQMLAQHSSSLPFPRIHLRDPLMPRDVLSATDVSSWTSIKQLRLEDVWRSDYVGLFESLSSLPSLEELIVRGCWAKPALSTAKTVFTKNPFPVLQRIDIDKNAAEHTSKWLLQNLDLQKPSTISCIRICQLWELGGDYGLYNAMNLIYMARVREVELHFNENLICSRAVPIPSPLWFNCTSTLEVAKLSTPHRLGAELLATWFSQPDFSPRLQRLEVGFASWDEDDAVVEPLFNKLDQKLVNRVETTQRVGMTCSFLQTDSARGDSSEMEKDLLRYMWRSLKGGIMRFAS